MIYNEYQGEKLSRLGFGAMRLDALPEDKMPSVCIACGKCKEVCPQNIDIPTAMEEFTQAWAGIPSWAEISRQREKELEKLRKQ